MMQAECFDAYIQCAQANPMGALAQDVSCTLTLISCLNAHLYGSLGEHRVERPREADVTGEAVLESEMVLMMLEEHAAEVQAYANRARQLRAMVATAEQVTWRGDLARDLDHFVQAIIQELSHRKG
jgi:hypothetical protein